MKKYLQFNEEGTLVLVSKTKASENDLEVEDSYVFQKEKEIVFNEEKMTIMVDKTKDEILEELFPKLSDEELLKQAKENKKTEINESCNKAIINGFESNCLGQKHTYQSEEQDQLNLIGLVATNLPNFFKCFDGEKWEYKIHTAEQLKQLLIDGGKHKTELLIKAGELKYLVDVAQTIEEVNQIVIGE